MFGKLNYPKTRTVDVVDDYFGTKVADPYRWLEDADSDEVQAWTQEQSDFAFELLGSLSGRSQFKTRLTEMWNFARYEAPFRRDNRLFFKKNDGLQNQPILYVQEEGGAERILLDGNTLSEDGTMALMETQASSDGSLLLYAASPGGSDWRELRVLDVETGEDLPDVITKVRLTSLAWMPDKSGFFYTRPSKTDESGDDNQVIYRQLMFHRLGTEQSEDKVLFERPDLPSSIFGIGLSDDNKYLVVFIFGGKRTANRFAYAEIAEDMQFIPLFDEDDAHYYFVGNQGDTFYIQTTLEAPRSRIIAVDLKNPKPENWREIIPETEPMDFASIVNQQLVVAYLQDAHHVVKVFGLDGEFVREINLPGLGAIVGFNGRAADSDLFINYTSFLNQPTVLRYDFKTDSTESFFENESLALDLDQYETKQVFFESKDGTSVPMFITAKKGLELNGDNPTILYGYGGFNISHTPKYQAWLPLWLEQGGVFVDVNLRGGSEYGEEWHVAGMLGNKQNVYDDYISAAEWLIENKYTSTKKLAIEGRSNGGLLVAAVMLQRPDLFGAVVCYVPVIDMLRFQHFTAGRYWTSEYGDANHSKEHFDFLYAYSPLHNVKQGQDYPPILILTGDHDDRVVPMHSKKFAATLQAANENNNVILFRIDTKAGHGQGKATDKLIEERSDVLAFLNNLFEMGVK